jgi:hypothetical protein
MLRFLACLFGILFGALSLQISVPTTNRPALTYSGPLGDNITQAHEIMLEVIANALRSRSARLVEECCRPYQNSKEEWGYCLTVWEAGHYHMVSVSHIDDMPTPESIATALLSCGREIADEGRYRNRNGTLGYYATVKSGDHWYMVSVSEILQPFHKQWWLEKLG